MTTQIRRFLMDLVTIFAFWLIFTTAGWQSFNIVSGSLEPTLEVGDRIMVRKFAYGYNRFSVPFNPKFLGDHRIFFTAPKRGDIALFRLPYMQNEDLIKRVIGLPGDTVQMKQGRLYINGKIVPRTKIRDVNYTDYQGMPQHATEYEETLPNGVKHRIYERTDEGEVDNTGLYVVPAGHYFMMGDNRDDSLDSRFLSHMGYVDQKYLVGRADITTFSLYDCDQGKAISCSAGIPLGRFFKVIH
ncbi:signal peptidase I [Kordiimonas marina]|uniref:signal peptidase I n=1 Tax=Kordiimonas marina TaxID=2872312 RepID=UPI001FF61AD2|nr:signal peptidase I [Kordiimonas marina]MCJ9429857.1 signal peptidase I [Kordiimonas marina]